jgi:hypothetical protein
MDRKNFIAGLALASILPLTAGAADLQWSYVDVRYTGYEEPGADGDGFGIGGSYAIGTDWYVLGAYDDLALEAFGFDVDATMWRIGLGSHRPVNDSAEVFTEITYEAISVSVLGFSADDNGYGFRFGLRGMVTDSFEASGGLRYVDTGFSDTLLSLGAVYHLNDRAGLTFNYEDGDSTLWAVGARFAF